ncbi:Hypp3210 [Branchiostoma lanceolatum]|uniref:Hypp3210 protein n=1 Tax=Branchiostoma lanceolatum TaxID=7740 RepID=A0A8K0A2T7_BRALA|nr:Hypp3210 [Branchiostoma lanceolatum]
MGYNGKYIQGIGWALVVMGSLNIVLGIVADVLFGVMGAFTIFHYISAPIWCGFLVVISGIVGIQSGKNSTSKGQMVAFLSCGMVTIFFGITCLLMAIIGALVDGNGCDRGHKSYHNPCSAPAIALHAVNGVLALAEIVVAFVGTIMSCSGLASPTVAYDQGPSMTPGQTAYVIVQPGAQGVPYPQQQVFVAQRPYSTQGYYGTMAPPPYIQQSNIGAAHDNAPAGQAAETKAEPPAYT